MRGGQPLKQFRWQDVVAPLCGILTVAAGVFIMLGWGLDIPVMRSLLPGFGSANLTVAVCMVLAGISQLTLTDRFTSHWPLRLSRLCAAILILLGVIVETTYMFGAQNLVSQQWRTAAGAGLVFGLAGCGLLAGHWRIVGGLRPSVWLGWIILVMAVLALIQQLVLGGLIIQHDIPSNPEYVVSTVLVLVIIGLGLIVTRSTALPDTEQQDETPSERRIFQTVYISLALLMSLMLAMLTISMENGLRSKELSQVLAAEYATSQFVKKLNAGVSSGSHSVPTAATVKDIAAIIPLQTPALRECLKRAEQDMILQPVAGTAELTAVRECMRGILAHLDSLRMTRVSRDTQAAKALTIIIFLGVLLLVPVGFACLHLLYRGLQVRRDATEDIRQANETLEKQVAERTAELAQSERSLRTLLDHFPGVAYRTVGGKAFIYDYVSAGSLEVLGVPPEEFTRGRSQFRKLIHPDDYGIFMESAKGLIGGHDVNQEYRIIRPDGEMRWLSAYIHPSNIVDGIVEQVEGFVVDITDRRLTDMSHKVRSEILSSLNSEATLGATLDILTGAVEEHCPGGLCSIMLTDESGQYLQYASAPSLPESYCLATNNVEIGPSAGSCGTAVFRGEGVIVEDIQTDPLWSSYRDEAAAAGLRSCWSIPISATDGKVLGSMVIYQRKTGQPSKQANDVMGWASFLASMAIQHVRQREDQTARLALEKTNDAKTRFLAVMSHEIRTPLNGVLGMVDLMLNTTQDPQQTKHIMGAIKESSDELRRVVDSIVEYSLSESADLTLDTEALDLSTLAHAVVASHTGNALGNDVQLRVTCDPGIPSPLLVDGKKLRQILFKLIDNAIKFSGRQAGRTGHVELNVEHCGGEDGMARICLTIRDDGIGMSPQELQHVTEPFSQSDISTTRAFSGAGLGLALTKQLLQLMDSKLKFSSISGQGLQVSFELLLPIGNSNHLQSPTPDSAQTPLEAPLQTPSNVDAEKLSDHRILLAEDNRMNQRVIVLQLQALGYPTDVAENGQDALAMWERGHYCLLLADFHMPKMDGFELTRQIREREEDTTEHMPIIGITASTIPREIELSSAVGMDGYISKPATLETLSQNLAQWLSFDDVDGPETQESVIDWTALGGYMGTDDKALLAEFFTDFLRHGANTLSEIEQAVAAQDASQVGALAHRLKSSARMVGAIGLADVCVLLESAGSETRWNDIHRDHPALQKLFTAVVAEAGNRGIVM